MRRIVKRHRHGVSVGAFIAAVLVLLAAVATVSGVLRGSGAVMRIPLPNFTRIDLPKPSSATQDAVRPAEDASTDQAVAAALAAARHSL